MHILPLYFHFNIVNLLFYTYFFVLSIVLIIFATKYLLLVKGQILCEFITLFINHHTFAFAFNWALFLTQPLFTFPPPI